MTATTNDLDKIRVQLSLGSLYFQLEQYELAEAAFHQADAPALRHSGDTHLQGIQAQNLGNTLLQRGLALWQISGDTLMQANTDGTLAEALVAQGSSAERAYHYEAALALLIDIDNAMAQRLRAEFTNKLAAQRKMDKSLCDRLLFGASDGAVIGSSGHALTGQ